MKKWSKAMALLLVMCLLIAGCGTEKQAEQPAEPTEAPQLSEELQGELDAFSSEVIDADLTCTITLGNWPPDTAAASELALFEGYKATMAKQYPNVTLVPDYYSYSLSNYVPMAKGGTAPSIF